MIKHITSIFLTTLFAFSVNNTIAQPRTDINFAFGGATTNSANATDAFALQDPGLAKLLADIRAFGLDVLGLTQQLEFAVETLNQVDPDKDLFWVYAGVNNYLAGEQDPSVPPNEIGLVLERLYSVLGARRFVVPNLPAIGDLPLFWDQSQEVKEGLNFLTLLHNQYLTEVIVEFVQNHPDVLIIPVDVFSVFVAHKTSGEFSEVNVGCDMVVSAEALALPGACAGFLYLDIVHPASEAWAPVAQAVADALAAEQVDRIITLGDSFSDLGSMSDTFVRALGVVFPGPPFTEGRFSEAENVVQQTEALLGVENVSRPFSQPLRLSETFTQTGKALITGPLFIPKQLSGCATQTGAKVTLRFATETCHIKCKYKYDGAGVFQLKRCKCSFSGGDLIMTQAVRVRLSSDVRSASLEWLYY